VGGCGDTYGVGGLGGRVAVWSGSVCAGSLVMLPD